jgi:hypothetical protein
MRVMSLANTLLVVGRGLMILFLVILETGANV